MVLLTTTTYDYNSYNEYLEFCELNYVNPFSEDSDEFYEWVSEMNQVALEDYWNLLDEKDAYGDHYLVTGTLGLWHGTVTIIPKSFDCIVDAVKACVSGSSIEDYDVVLDDNGVISVKSCHHDGTNNFEIRKFTEEGYDEYENADYENGNAVDVDERWFCEISV